MPKIDFLAFFLEVAAVVELGQKFLKISCRAEIVQPFILEHLVDRR